VVKLWPLGRSFFVFGAFFRWMMAGELLAGYTVAGTVTALKFQQSHRQRVSVYLDGQYAFGLPDIVAAQLAIGQVLADEEIAELQEQDNLEQAYQRSLQLLSHRARSSHEIRSYLQQRLQATPEAIEEIVARLTSSGYLDDEQFARTWVSDRERFRPRSPAALRSELRQKGVAEEHIAHALSEIDDQASALHAGRTYVRRLQNLDERSFRQKLGNHLLRRGFTHGVVWPVVDRIWREQGGDENQEESSDMEQL
jgi:regulatory protein